MPPPCRCLCRSSRTVHGCAARTSLKGPPETPEWLLLVSRYRIAPCLWLSRESSAATQRESNDPIRCVVLQASGASSDQTRRYWRRLQRSRTHSRACPAFCAPASIFRLSERDCLSVQISPYPRLLGYVGS